MVTFWALLKTLFFKKKITVANFWVTFGKIGLLFLSTSGHTQRDLVPNTHVLLSI